MDLIRKTNGWSCILEAFAMAMDTTTDELIREIGHSGSQIMAPALPEPQCRRGFHIQELIQVAIRYGKSVTPFELIPSSLFVSGDTLKITNNLRESEFLSLIRTKRGVITGMSRRTMHAVAIDRGKVYDSVGLIYDFSFANCEAHGFFAQCLWIVE